MSKSSRNFKLPPVGSSSVSSISGGESGRSLEAMLHVTQVQTSEVDDSDLYFRVGTEKPKFDLSKKISIPDFEEQVPTSPPYVALVSNLPMECTERELNKVFNNFSIRSLTIPKKGKRPKGFAYVEMDSREDLIRLLQQENLKCRGRCLMIKLCEDRLASVISVTLNPPVNQNNTPRWPASESSFYGRDTPIRRKPSSTEELERRMELRLEKLAEFENAQSERAQNRSMHDQDAFSMSWSDILSETRNSEAI
ncbi:hypothetical protein M5D96_006356 [Drosophila gunungcola]|uniref:RRM domain-containing protein n=1 Tax=Drosophila gunungcola TaxID=103775 RepID=A0A9P9YNU7_9MUSC|nr:hypothetical protein M5D96_006356 [Drosophila gunungcola]